jgi:tetratricopeptide (TPR) repeat protein
MSRLADRLTGLDRAARAAPRVGGLPSLAPSEGREQRWNPVPLLVILLVIVMATVIGGAVLLRRTPGGPAEAPERLAQPHEAGLSAVPSGWVAPAGMATGESQAALIDRAMAQARTGALAEAAGDLRQALAREPLRADLWNNLGVVLVRAGDIGAGVAAFREALAIAPGDAETHRNLAVALDRRGHAVEAARHYRAFLDAASPDHPDRAEVDRRLAERGPRRGTP